MRSSKINKMVQNDAKNWAYALMFHGEGAGTRRRLLWAEIDEKIYQIPGYKELFDKAMNSQNMAQHAINAAKERKRLDRSHFVRRNLGALARGDRRSMSNGFAAVLIVGTVAHTTGYDKRAYDFVKGEYRIAKKRVQKWNDRRKADPAEVSRLRQGE